MSPDYVTLKELHRRLEKIQDRITRLERYLVLVAAAVASPKLGGPNPADLASVVVSLFS